MVRGPGLNPRPQGPEPLLISIDQPEIGSMYQERRSGMTVLASMGLQPLLQPPDRDDTARVLHSDEQLRSMYAGGRADTTALRFSRFWAKFFRLGLMPKRWVTLEVVGRESGRMTRFPLGLARFDGNWYAVSMLGERCNWVKNVRAAGGRAVLWRRSALPCRLIEVPPNERASILKRYLEQVPGGRPHLPVDYRAPVSAFEGIADDYPVFRVDVRPE